MKDRDDYKRREAEAWSSLDREKIANMPLAELKKLFLQGYEAELDATLDAGSIPYLAGGYFMEKTWPARIQKRIAHAKDAVDTLKSGSVNYRRWSRAAYWTVDETCALLCGFDPEKLPESFDDLHLFAAHDPCIKEFFDLMKMLGRHLNVENRLNYGDWRSNPLGFGRARIAPVDAIAWATEFGVELPADLATHAATLEQDTTEPEPTAKKQRLRSDTEENYLRIIALLYGLSEFDAKPNTAAQAMRGEMQLWDWDRPGVDTVADVLKSSAGLAKGKHPKFR